jgi:hypothetical protein
VTDLGALAVMGLVSGVAFGGAQGVVLARQGCHARVGAITISSPDLIIGIPHLGRA